MTELQKLNLMKKFKELNVAEYTTKYGDYYGLMFAGADIATKELQGELEKENTELKEKNKWYSEQVCNKECAEVWGNLTKAKELLAKWVELFKPKGGNIPPTPIQVDTEQFLSEVEK